VGQIKDKALNKPNEKKFTLTEGEINTLMQYRQVAQQDLDRLLQDLTSVYLHSIATGRLGYATNCNLGFALNLDSPQDNITITNLG
jgi:hypothetical protein